MAVLIVWLTTGDNYDQQCGGDKQNGATKYVIVNEICQIIKNKGRLKISDPAAKWPSISSSKLSSSPRQNE